MAEAEKRKYTIVTPVDFDNKRYEPGKTIALDQDTAAPLVACGAVAELAAKK